MRFLTTGIGEVITMPATKMFSIWWEVYFSNSPICMISHSLLEDK